MAETVNISSQNSAINRSRKEYSVPRTRSSRQREVERMEFEILMATEQAEQQLRDQQIQLKINEKK